jgi:hypothetical protein
MRATRIRLAVRGVGMIFDSLIFVVFFCRRFHFARNAPLMEDEENQLPHCQLHLLCGVDPPLVILLWLSTVVDWFAARGLARTDQEWKRRAWMLVPSSKTSPHLAALAGLKYSPPRSNIVLPVGISTPSPSCPTRWISICAVRSQLATFSITPSLLRSFLIWWPGRSCDRTRSAIRDPA